MFRQKSAFVLESSLILLILQFAIVFEAQAEFGSIAEKRVRKSEKTATSILRTQPLRFEKNIGQAEKNIKYIARGVGFNLLLSQDETVFVFDPAYGSSPSSFVGVSPEIVHMKLRGACSSSKIIGIDLQNESSYLIGNDSRKWRVGIPAFSKVHVKGARTGIDLMFHGIGTQLEYDLILSPGSHPREIGLEFEGLRSLQIGKDGSLIATTSTTSMIHHRPIGYQEVDGRRKNVEVRYVLLRRNAVGFELGAYDKTKRLFIDPVVSYSSFAGGTGADEPSEGDSTVTNSIAADLLGNIYVTGFTTSTDFPLRKPFQKHNAGGDYDVFVLKINSTGKLIYSTYLGGSGYDGPPSITVDRLSNIYLAGSTSSKDFPVVHPLQSLNHGRFDAFIMKLDPSGSRIVFSTYIGGSNDDICHAIAIDSLKNIYITGTTSSNNFPTAQSIQSFRRPSEAFLLKLSSDGSHFVYSTYLGGGDKDVGNGLTVDRQQNVFVTGFTRVSTPVFPTTIGAFQRKYKGGLDAFITKFNSSGTMTYSTLIGGGADDRANAIAIDRNGNVYITGRTLSGDFPTKNPLQNQYKGGLGDVFVAELNAAGSALVFSTYIGGSSIDTGTGIAVGPSGYVYVTGGTSSVDFPFLGGFQSANNGSEDAFLVRLSPEGAAISYSTFLGGISVDEGRSIVLDLKGNVYVVGKTSSPDFPVIKGFQNKFAGDTDTFIIKVSPK